MFCPYSDINLLRSCGYSSLIVADQKPAMSMKKAVFAVAKMVQGQELEFRQPFTGRCNLYAKAAGLLSIISITNCQFNQRIRYSLLPCRTFFACFIGPIVATIKIIPFCPSICTGILSGNKSCWFAVIFFIASFQKEELNLIQTELPDIQVSIQRQLQTMKRRTESLEALSNRTSLRSHQRRYR